MRKKSTAKKGHTLPWIFTAALTTLLLVPSIGRAQSVSFGLYVGAPLSDLASAESSMAATTGRYTFGPALQVGLPYGFNFEADLLYKRFAFGVVSNPASLTVHRLEMPLLLRYVFHDSRVHLFLQGGMSLNRVIAVGGSSACADAIASKGFYCIQGEPAVQLRHRHTHGFVMGAGMDLGRGRVRLRPELMITEWVDRNFGTKDSILRSNLTQVELLLGLKF